MPNRFKLAVVTPFFPIGTMPYRGRATYQLVRALQASFDVHVICPVTSYPRFLKPKRYDYRSLDKGYDPGEISVDYVEYPGVPMLSRPINGWVCARFVEPLLRKIRPDVALNYWIYPEGRGAVLAARRNRIPIVVGAIGSDLNAIPDRVTRLLARRTMLDADHVITKSAALRQKALTMGIPGQKITVISNGCDPQMFQVANRATARAELGLSQHERIALFVGRLDAIKGVRELADACLQLKKRRPDLRLALVGDGPLFEHLQTLQSEPGGDWITLANRCSPAEVSRWMTASDLLVLPSYAEGCPNVVVEALSCGRPIVASNVGGIPELVNEACGVLVPPRQVSELTRALDSALSTPWDESNIAAHFGRTWKQVAAEVEGVLLRVLENSERFSTASV